MHQGATWYGGRPRPRRLCVRWGPSLPSAKKAAELPPQFSAHFYCGQTVGCIKMPLSMEVGLSPGDFLLHGDPAPSAKRGQSPSPVFGPFLLWPNGWMHQDATWYVGKPQPRFSAHVYYSYCDFVRTLHNRYWFAQVQVQVLFLEKV